VSGKPLSSWQLTFFDERARTPASGTDGVYYREQVFGALEVLSDALPEIEEALGANGFRFFVRELLAAAQPTDSLGTSLIEPFLEFLSRRPELSSSGAELALIAAELETWRAKSAQR
jgi:hypothetical protein